MNNCLFCKIANGEIPSKTLYEDERIRVFLDIDQTQAGHTLIIPKKHYTDLDDIDEEVLFYIMKESKKFKKILEERLKPDGIKLSQHNGCIQDVKHYHLHLIPIYNEEKKLSIEEVYELLTK